MYRAAAEEMVAQLVVAVRAEASAPAAAAAARDATPPSLSAADTKAGATAGANVSATAGGATRYVLARRALDARAPPSNATTRDTHHLACFVPGMLSLAALEELSERTPRGVDAAEGEGEGDASGRALSVGTGSSDRARLSVARELLRTCVDLYRLSPSGLAPESVELRAGGELGGKFITLDPSYHLRPELVESLFMWSELTVALRRDEPCGASLDATCAARGEGGREGGEWGDGAAARRPPLGGPDALGESDDAVAAQRIAWRIFRAIETNCRAPHGYAGVEDVRAASGSVSLLDVQPSFFLAETLKYLYLLFSNERSLGVGMSEREPEHGHSAAAEAEAEAARAAADGNAVPTRGGGGSGVDVQTLLRRAVFSTEAHPLPRLTEVLGRTPGAAALALPDETESAALPAALRSCAQRFGGSFRETCAACATGWQRVGDDPRWACALRCYCPDGSGALRATMCTTYARDAMLSNMGGRLARDGTPCSAL